MRVTIEANRHKLGRVQLAITMALTTEEKHEPIAPLTERAVLLHDLAMTALNEWLVANPKRQSYQSSASDDDPAVQAALDAVRHLKPTSNTPPERESVKVRLRAELVRLKRAAGIPE